MPSIIFFELGRTGSLLTSSFQGLSGGKTCMAARTLSASGVLKRTGALISGSRGRSRAPRTAGARRARAAATANRRRGMGVLRVGAGGSIIRRRGGGRQREAGGNVGATGDADDRGGMA